MFTQPTHLLLSQYYNLVPAHKIAVLELPAYDEIIIIHVTMYNIIPNSRLYMMYVIIYDTYIQCKIMDNSI